jgi:hypothetical protein
MIKEATARALKIIQDHSITKAEQFALFMWPDSYMHRKTSNQGHGATRGKAAWLKGGSFIGQLDGRGFLENRSRWRCNYDGQAERLRLSQKGLEALNEYETKNNSSQM